MRPIFRPALGLLALLAALSPVSAQDSADDLKELRALVEKQSKQIDALTEQVARLNHTLSAKAAAAPEAPTPPVLPPAAMAPAPAPAPAAPPAPNEFPPDAPRAELAHPGPRHVVVKGETLTSIAKQYTISLAELQKANKDVNDRKLQIGQTLQIPASKTPEAAPEKKENP